MRTGWLVGGGMRTVWAGAIRNENVVVWLEGE